MDASIYWFIAILGVSALSLMLGLHLGRGPKSHGRIGLIIGVVLLGLWAWLMKNPAVALEIIPLQVLSRIEGTAAVPVFFAVVGIAWSRSRLSRQRRLVAWAFVLGAIYLIQGGAWMLQSTPSVGFAQTIKRDQPVRQSQEYSCVPAACATALNILGYYTTEAEMARLTYTRPGTGSTIIRAMDGLSRRLAGSGYEVKLLQPSYEELRRLPMPALTPLQLESTRRHMVTILSVDPDWVEFSDPVEGEMSLPRDVFEHYYVGQVLVFQRQTGHGKGNP